eukprot:gb/GFBE01050127.1/.p1 GENE.gb/GFBE01050127.1/~~gb/GFBE01050127.1/.p1  ORF type:complete len:147 (+),score=23.04 gb/GFBE01050127.1/:1-441(+)
MLSCVHGLARRAPSAAFRGTAVAAAQGGHRHASSRSRGNDGQVHMAKMYLREYIKAKEQGDVSGALRLLAKAKQVGRYVHVEVPEQGAVPLAAVVPTFAYSEASRPLSVLPITVDGRQEKTRAARPTSRASKKAHPVPLIVPFSGR